MSEPVERAWLEWIAESTAPVEAGGFHPNAVAAAKWALSEIARLKREYDEEVLQFNAGHNRAERHNGPWPKSAREFEPDSTERALQGLGDKDHDTFGSGFAWGAYERLVSEIARLNGQTQFDPNAELQARLDEARAMLDAVRPVVREAYTFRDALRPAGDCTPHDGFEWSPRGEAAAETLAKHVDALPASVREWAERSE